MQLTLFAVLEHCFLPLVEGNFYTPDTFISFFFKENEVRTRKFCNIKLETGTKGLIW